MKNKISIIYSWFIRLCLIWVPNYPIFRRFRGYLYSLGMPKCGNNFQVNSNVTITTLIGLKVGTGVRIAHNVVIIGRDITIEDDVIIGPNCVIVSGNHTFDGECFSKSPCITSPVRISKGCWIGANSTILAGSVIPPRSIVGAGSVVNKKFQEEHSLFGGVPAKFIKEL